ncbi:MAG: ABC transporter ATP-binding protein, partial [Clostridia bacterium]|nr:ABC transporter ATP-binding protein [Clostridia bacterium]
NGEKPKQLKRTLGRLFRYIGKSKVMLIGVLLATLCVTIADLIGPALQGEAIKTIVYDEATKHITVDFERLLYLLGGMAVIYALSSLFGYVQSFISAKLSQTTVHMLRRDLFKKISKLPIKYTDTHSHGDIMSRMTNDVENVSNTISQSVASLMSSLLTLIGAFAMMLKYSWQLTLIAMITIPLTIFLSSYLAKFMRKYYKRQQQLLGELNGKTEEMVTGYKTVMAYGREQAAIEDFAVTSEEYKKVGIKARTLGGLMGPVMNVIGNLQYLVLATAGGLFAIKGVLRIGDIHSVLQYSKKFTRPVNEIANQYAQILTALAGAERIFDMLDTEDEIDEGTTEMPEESVIGNVSFDNVHFSYVPEKPVLKGLDLAVRPGQKIAIVGATGSGKTTVVNLLTRFYETDSGSITLDGVDIREIPKKDLRGCIGMVLQDTVLFADTIEANIRMGKTEASEEEMKEAARVAHASDFIERLPDGYATVLAEGGSNLSQGQRQLISIARAVLNDPKILILDEATSSVDTRTEKHIQDALNKLMEGRTAIIIAHRLSTIIDSDMIVVISDGAVAECGTHEELLLAGGEYAKLYRNQYAGIET